MAASGKETDCFDSNSKCKDTSDEWNSREKDGFFILEMPFYILVQVYCYCRKVRLSLKWLKSSATTIRYTESEYTSLIHACDNIFLLHDQAVFRSLKAQDGYTRKRKILVTIFVVLKMSLESLCVQSGESTIFLDLNSNNCKGNPSTAF